MNIQRRELYVSPNGDVWSLCREPDGEPFIFHEPNVASGGQSSKVAVGTFLSDGYGRPEQQALMKLISGLVNPAESAEYDDHD